MALQFQKIKGKGWKSLTTKLCKKDDLDLLELVDYNPTKYPFLLESSSRGNKRNRFSILFYKPKFLIKKEKENNVNFLNEFDRLWKSENLNQEKTIDITLSDNLLKFIQTKNTIIIPPNKREELKLYIF